MGTTDAYFEGHEDVLKTFITGGAKHLLVEHHELTWVTSNF
jgi:hypothetical protein